jgi:hypothetical protein
MSPRLLRYADQFDSTYEERRLKSPSMSQTEETGGSNREASDGIHGVLIHGCPGSPSKKLALGNA